MIEKVVIPIGKIYQVCRVTVSAGDLFTVNARKSEGCTDWHLIEATADTGYMASRLVGWGVANDYGHALRLLNS